MLILDDMLKLNRAARAARHFAKAQEQVIQRDYRGALASIEKVASIMKTQPATVEMPLRCNVITLQSAYWLSLDELAVQSAQALVFQLLNGREYKGADKPYIAEYLFQLFEFCAGRFSKSTDKFIGAARDISSIRREYDPSDVSSSLKYEMPIVDGLPK